jgi:uncharacterized protein (UPF0261 family)/ABC-type branched-subunit amino acid transport system ATPase component
MATKPSWLKALGGAGGGNAAAPILDVRDLDVYYGRAHALQGVSLTLHHGVLAVVGRNGMGKTTLCNAITGLVPAAGEVRFEGQSILGLPSHRITELGIGYVPQGRRVWPSLSVDEHLRLSERTARRGDWTVARIYELFPRLAERKNNGGAQLSGGEQQMLAIGRALLFNPKLLVMDEPTEGLAPVIVDQVAAMLKALAEDGRISVLLIEQNLGVALDVADTVAVMVNGRIASTLPARELAANRELQQRLLGVKAGDGELDPSKAEAPAAPVHEAEVLTIRRAGNDAAARPIADLPRSVRGITRWNAASADADPVDRWIAAPAVDHNPAANTSAAEPGSIADWADSGLTRLPTFSIADATNRAAYVAGTFDTKGRELLYLQQCLAKIGLRTVTVDLSTSGALSTAQVAAREVARHHPDGERAVFTHDRGSAVSGMAIAFKRFLLTRGDVGGVISAGGSGATALATPAMRALPIGVPKLMVSTVASGDTRPYVGPSDLCMMYSVTDVQGLNRISTKVLANAAHALAGMIVNMPVQEMPSRPAIGLSMFGVTTPCVQAVTRLLGDAYDCLVFHATGIGGQAMEKLADSGLLAGVIDATTTEIADELMGGVFSAGRARMDVFARSRLPYVGSCGALDMVNFGAFDTVPDKYKARLLYKHNANVTLMRTTPAENTAMGEFIAAKLNAMDGPVRFVLPEGGVSLIDAPGQPFWLPEADRALFAAIEKNFKPAANRKLIKRPENINDPAFADALVAAFHEVCTPVAAPAHAVDRATRQSQGSLHAPH